MRTRIILCLLCSAIALSAHAQGHNSAMPFGSVQASVMSVAVGPLALAGVAVNAGSVAPGTKAAPGIAFAPGAIVDFTYSRTVGFDLGVVYDWRGISFHDAANSASATEYSFGYLALRPELRFDGFLIGVGLGIPVSANTNGTDGALAPAVRIADVTPLFEGRLGGMMELFSNQAGTLDLLAEASYAFSRNLTSAWFHGADETNNNGPMATAELGICYLFDVYSTAPAAQPTATVEDGATALSKPAEQP